MDVWSSRVVAFGFPYAAGFSVRLHSARKQGRTKQGPFLKLCLRYPCPTTTMSASGKLADTPNVPIYELFSLKGQVALVTGGSRGEPSFCTSEVCPNDFHFSTGIGAAMVIGLAQAGADIVLAQRDVSNTTTRDTVRAAGRRCEIIDCDLTKPASVKTCFDRGVAMFGGIDILINCGGMLKRQDTVDIDDSDWNEVSVTTDARARKGPDQG